MKKRFDFIGRENIGFLKKIRIHPKFSSWKKELAIFSFSLFFIFFSSLIFSFYSHQSSAFQNIKNAILSLSLNYNNELSITSVQKDIQKFSTEVLTIIQQIEETLPPKEYSQIKQYSEDIKDFSGNILVLAESLTHLEKSFLLAKSEADFSLLLNYIDQYEALLLRLHSQAQSLINLSQSFISKKRDISEADYEGKRDSRLRGNDTKGIEKLLSYHIKYSNYIHHFPQILQSLKSILGDKDPHSIIVWFQNSNEKRATGGFIGSFLELTFNDGKVQKFQAQDIYKYDRNITEKLQAPELAQSLVGKNSWSLRDSNYSPDFSVSAQSFLDFYEKAGGNTVDTIIAVDQRILEDLLSIIGEVSVPLNEFLAEDQITQKSVSSITLNAENAAFIISYIVEGKLSKSINPKYFLTDALIPKVLEKASQELQISDVFSLYEKQKKQVHLYSRNDDVLEMRKVFVLGNAFEEIMKNSQSMYINEVSISGNKSGAFIKQDIAIQKKEGAKKRYQMSITRKHTWGTAEEALFENLRQSLPNPKIPSKELKRILGAGTYHSSYQVFLPLGAKNIQVTPKEIPLKVWKEGKRLVAELDVGLLEAQKSDKIVLEFEYGGEEIFVFSND
jgi:hypothetical protein